MAVLGPPPATLLGLFSLAFLLVCVVALLQYRRARRRSLLVVAVAMALGCAAFTGLAAYTSYETYVSENTWAFEYSVTVTSNGTGPESIVLPIPEDETLLQGLRLTSGTANWSLVTTSRGRGLFVRFSGGATLDAYVSVTPRPAVLPDTTPTMAVISNCTAEPSNCTGQPSLWVFYSGLLGAHLSLTMSTGSIYDDLLTGWAEYPLRPIPMPAL